MATDALESVLNASLSVELARERIDAICPLIREGVNHGTHAVRRCQIGLEHDEANVHAAPFALYQHILEIGDAVEILFRGSCVNPAIPLVRSLFEAVLQLEFILETEATYRQRSLQWLVSYVRARIDQLEAADPDCARGKRFQGELARDRANVEPAEGAQLDSLRTDIAQYRQLLRSEQCSDVDDEYSRRQSGARGRAPAPYSLFDGPANLRQLAQHLKHAAFYDFLYPMWSSVAHGADLRRFLGKHEAGEATFVALRDAKDMLILGEIAYGFVLKATELMIGKFRSAEDLRPWANREIRPLQQRLDILKRSEPG